MIRLDSETCNSLMNYMCMEGMKELNSPLGSPAIFNYLLVEGVMKNRVEMQLGLKFHTLRLHHFSPHHFATEHTDTAYPTYETFILRLDSLGGSRLKVGGVSVEEVQGEGRLLPPETVHEILKGDPVRYTLCGWVEG